MLPGVPIVWLQEQAHSGCDSIVSLLARLFLPWSNPLPAQLSPACADLTEQGSCWAGGPCSFNLRSFSLAPSASTSAGQWPEKPKRSVPDPSPYFIQHNRSVPDPSPCGLDKTQTVPKLVWALLLLPEHFCCLGPNFLNALTQGWKYVWSQAVAANRASHLAPVWGPYKGHFTCKVLLCHVSAQTQDIITQLRLVVGVGRLRVDLGEAAPSVFKRLVNKISPCEVFAVSLGATSSCLVPVTTPQHSLLTAEKQMSTQEGSGPTHPCLIAFWNRNRS